MYALRKQLQLAFPGRKSGFDPTHPASNGIVGTHGYSCIACGINAINLITGAKLTSAGGDPFTAKTTAFGPGAAPNGGNAYLTTPAVAKTDSKQTLAAIIYMPSSLASADCCDSGGGAAAALETQASGALCCRLDYTTNITTMTPLKINTPYFLACSFNGSIINFLALNLLNGQIFTESDAQSGSPGTSATTYDAFSSSILGSASAPILATMFAPSYLSMPQLYAWATDPWAFWYPHTYFDTFDWLSTVSSGGVTTYFTASPGTYSITGDAITDNLEFVSSAGSYSITGDAITDTLELVSSPGTYSITGDSITDTQDFVVSPGVYSISGDVTSELLAASVSAGSYSLTGTTETYTLGVSVSAGQYLISGFMISSPGSGTIDNLPFIVTLGRLKSF